MNTLKINRKMVLAAATFAALAIAYLLHEMLACWLLAMFGLKHSFLMAILNTPTGASQGPNTNANGFNATNCDPRLIVFDDTNGSLTRANITGWNKSDIESSFFKELGLDKIIAQTKEARMAGSKQRTLTDLLMSRMAPLSVGGGVNTQSVVQPFRLVPRRNRVNPGYFRVSGGVSLANFVAQGGSAGSNTSFTGLANGTITLNSAVTACWVLTVNNGSIDQDSSPFAKSPNNVLKNPERYFLPRHSLTSEFVYTNGSKVTAQLRVVDSAAGPDANQAYVLVIPNRSFKGDSTIPAGVQPVQGYASVQATGVFGTLSTSTNGWWEGNAGAQFSYQATSGIVQIGANSVSDYQQYGNSIPGYNEYGLQEYWRQTNRWVHQYNDEYVKALEAATTSDGLKKFRLLPLAKLRAQQERMNEDAFFQTCFYGDIENENQTISTWNNLPVVQDPAWAASGQSGTLNIEYLSRTLGFRTQIAACGNVYDSQQQPFDLDGLFEALYYVKREREGESNAEVSDIDVLTDLRFTRPMFRQLMNRYYKAKYGLDSITGRFELGKQVLSFDGAVMFEYDSYEIPDYGYTLHIFSNQYFDDKVAMLQNSQKSAGRAMWVIDWTDITVNVIKNMSVPRTNNLADNVYKFVIQQNVQHVLLNSRTFEVYVGNTNRHRIFENYSDACFKVTVPGCDLSASR